MNLFWEEQQKHLKSSKQGIRYHPAIIHFYNHNNSTAVYEAIKFE